MKVGTIPIGDAWTLHVPSARTRAIRLALAFGLAVVAVAAYFAARERNLNPTPLLPPGSRGIIVLDLSSSVEHGTLDRMYAGLTQLGATNDRFGVVVFSARAYEAMPPNTPARELAPIARFFHELPKGAAPVVAPGPRLNPLQARYPTNPWANGFSGGTEISTGLALARKIILNNVVTRPAVWLMSDLADDAPDRASVARVARSYVNLGIPLHIVALNPLKRDEQFFERLLGPRGSLIEAKPSTRVRLTSRYGFPLWLAITTIVMSLLLTANELLSNPLSWGRR